MVGFPLEFGHGAQFGPGPSPLSPSIFAAHMITASERRSLNGDDHVSNFRNMRMSPSWDQRAPTAVEDRNMKCNEKTNKSNTKVAVKVSLLCQKTTPLQVKVLRKKVTPFHYK